MIFSYKHNKQTNIFLNHRLVLPYIYKSLRLLHRMNNHKTFLFCGTLLILGSPVSTPRWVSKLGKLESQYWVDPRYRLPVEGKSPFFSRSFPKLSSILSSTIVRLLSWIRKTKIKIRFSYSHMLIFLFSKRL